MKKQTLRGILLLGLLVLAGVIALWPKIEPGATRSRLDASAAAAQTSFVRAAPGREFVFPEDHGPHLDYQTEWWYFTGNLQTAEGRAFGYQLTFFRRGLIPGAERAERDSQWASADIYMAHFAISDVQNGRFVSEERLQRGAAPLAGARSQPLFSVWLEPWQVSQLDADRFRLSVRGDDGAVELELTDLKGPVLQGDRGYSRKGDEPGNASYYYSLTRLQSNGTLSLNGEDFTVNGLSWMDHEFSTSALGAGQTGWDWFALQLDDGSELMLFTLMREDGERDAFDSATLIEADGSVKTLSQADFSVKNTGTWRSPHSGGVYPVGWTIAIPGEDLELEVRPRFNDQEHNLSFTYWEGAVMVTGARRGEALQGSGYLELTGYAHSMQGEF